MSQESMEEYRIRKLEEAVSTLMRDMSEMSKMVTEIRIHVVEGRVKQSFFTAGIPTLLALVISGAGLWIK